MCCCESFCEWGFERDAQRVCLKIPKGILGGVLPAQNTALYQLGLFS